MGGMLFLVPLLMRSKFGWLILLVVGGFFLLRGTGVLSPGTSAESGAGTKTDTQADTVQFVSFVLDDTQSTWTKELSAHGAQYRRAKMVLFTDSTSTGCGFGQAATGPFYCPADERVYIDLGFFRQLRDRFGAKGEFAQAYVIAHEVGHHVQNLLGISDKVHAVRGGKGEGGALVRLELQADCFAGIWARSTEQRNLLERGDLDSALGAANAIGDDRLQKQSTGHVVPESWTHGSSEQRSRWLKRGYDQGKMEACDTFAADTLLPAPSSTSRSHPPRS
jgi:uncharacterized protein